MFDFLSNNCFFIIPSSLFPRVQAQQFLPQTTEFRRDVLSLPLPLEQVRHDLSAVRRACGDRRVAWRQPVEDALDQHVPKVAEAVGVEPRPVEARPERRRDAQSVRPQSVVQLVDPAHLRVPRPRPRALEADVAAVLGRLVERRAHLPVQQPRAPQRDAPRRQRVLPLPRDEIPRVGLVEVEAELCDALVGRPRPRPSVVPPVVPSVDRTVGLAERAVELVGVRAQDAHEPRRRVRELPRDRRERLRELRRGRIERIQQ